jgi:enterochelin esterase-like enzyme
VGRSAFFGLNRVLDRRSLFRSITAPHRIVMKTSCWFAFMLFCVCFITARAADAPIPSGGVPQSPRLASLLSALNANDPSALDAFWKDVERNHTPLVEEVPKQPHDALFTFVIRADAADDVMNARLGSDFPMRTPQHTDTFQRLGMSNVWYTSYVLPKSSMIVYRIRVPQGLNRLPSSPARFTIDGVLYEHFLDPLNPRVFPEGEQHIDAPTSFYMGPEVELNPYLQRRAGVASGSLQKFAIDSRVLAGKRGVTVYTPAAYASNSKALPFILLFDAEAYLDVVAAPTILDNMISQSVIPPAVVAFVHSEGTRDQDLPPNADFQAFIGSDLMPWVRQRYRIAKDPKLNIVGGSSLGGLAAAYTAFVHPDMFGKVLSQSGSYWWDANYLNEVLPSANAGWMVKQFAEAAPKPIRFYMVVGSWEAAGMVSSTRILHSVLMGKGNEVTYREVTAGHNYENIQQTLPDALIALLGGRKRNP